MASDQATDVNEKGAITDTEPTHAITYCLLKEVGNDVIQNSILIAHFY